MFSTRFSLAASSFFCASLWTAILLAEDWPRWGGRDDCNMISGEKGLPATFVPGRKSPQGSGIDMRTTQNVRWIARLGTQTYGNPTVANGRVYVGTNDEDLQDPRVRSTRGGLVMCFDEATGKLLWQLIVRGLKRTCRNSISTTWAWASARRQPSTATASTW